MGRSGWRSSYRRLVVAGDAVALAAASLAAWSLRFEIDDAGLIHRGPELSYLPFALALVPVWLAALAVARGYERRFLGAGSEEYHRVLMASVPFAALLALVGHAARLEITRGFIGLALPLGTVALLVARRACRAGLAGVRAHGTAIDRVLAVGAPEHVADLVSHLRRDGPCGMDVVGACIPGGGAGEIAGVPVVGTMTAVEHVAVEHDVDAIAVTACPAVTSRELRRLSWSLEGSGIDLLLASALTDVAGPRVSLRPVAGVPFVHVAEPELRGVRQVAKGLVDRSLALAGLVALAPVLLAIAAAVRLTSRGPALFRQQRVGRHGEPFTMVKFRSMYRDAEARQADFARRNESDGPLFKMRHDPRVTTVGRFLRKWSLDELPQLVNVVAGDMSLVGPRPPLPAEVARYEPDVRRRLLVKPGVTGRWQVSGRSDLSWEESVRHDLYYVENWSLGLDLSILAGTVGAVVKGTGAY